MDQNRGKGKEKFSYKYRDGQKEKGPDPGGIDRRREKKREKESSNPRERRRKRNTKNGKRDPLWNPYPYNHWWERVSTPLSLRVPLHSSYPYHEITDDVHDPRTWHQTKFILISQFNPLSCDRVTWTSENLRGENIFSSSWRPSWSCYMCSIYDLPVWSSGMTPQICMMEWCVSFSPRGRKSYPMFSKLFSESILSLMHEINDPYAEDPKSNLNKNISYPMFIIFFF